MRAYLRPFSISAFILGTAGVLVACSVGSTQQATPIMSQERSPFRFSNVLTAGPMPTPMSPEGSGADARYVPRIDTPSNIEIVPLAIPGNQMASIPHYTPDPNAGSAVASSACTSMNNCDAAAPRPMNTIVPNNAGEEGYYLYSGSASGVGDIYVAMTAYDDVDIDTPTTNANVLYAPTTHGPNGNCLELSTNYFNGYSTTGHTVREVQVWDFCANGWAGAIPIDADFLNKYVRVYSNGPGLPQYVAEIAEGTDKKWHAYIYNNDNGYWDDVYQSGAGLKAEPPYTAGWSVFESHFGSPGPCSMLPELAESGLRLHYSDASNQDWQYPTGNWTFLKGGSCFHTPAVSPYYVYAQHVQPDVSWEVTTH